jgi:hypothetical protein
MSNPGNLRLRGAVKLALTGAATTVDLSELSANRTLVLVNGLRLTPAEPRAVAAAVAEVDENRLAQAENAR